MTFSLSDRKVQNETLPMCKTEWNTYYERPSKRKINKLHSSQSPEQTDDRMTSLNRRERDEGFRQQWPLPPTPPLTPTPTPSGLHTTLLRTDPFPRPAEQTCKELSHQIFDMAFTVFADNRLDATLLQMGLLGSPIMTPVID